MKRFLLLIGFSAAAFNVTAAQRSNDLYRVSGRIFDASTERPLAGTAIVFSVGPFSSQRVVTDSTGRYQIDAPLAGTARALASGYLPETMRVHTDHGMDFYLQPTNRLFEASD